MYPLISVQPSREADRNASKAEPMINLSQLKGMLLDSIETYPSVWAFFKGQRCSEGGCLTQIPVGITD
jgi:hypothetical protein